MENEERIISLLEQILETLQGGIKVTKEYNKNIYSEPMSQEEKDDLDGEIDLEWWFMSYGEDPHPAKFMDRQNLGYDSKRELDYMHKRLAEIAECRPDVNGGTHVFVNVGKTYCKAVKNTLNCFACVPKEQM